MNTTAATVAPPTVEQVQAALNLLELDPRLHRQAALHLATPTSSVLGVDITKSTEGWCFRGETIPEGPRAVEEAVMLATLGHDLGDRYLDLSGDPARWCKLVRQGDVQVLAGAGLLFRMPPVQADPTVPLGDVVMVTRLWLTDPTFRPPAVLEGRCGALLVDGGRELVTITHVEPPRG
jgi:hypothetical protein